MLRSELLSYLILMLVIPSFYSSDKPYFSGTNLAARPSFGFGLFLLMGEDFICSEKVKPAVEVSETQHWAGCYVEIAPIWNVIKVVWLLASGGKNTFHFPPLPSSQMKMYSVFG